MVLIRLTRGGVTKRPFYRIVVTDSRKRRDGGYIEQLGYFNPIAAGQDMRLSLNVERAQYWLKQGAKPSQRVASLLREQAKAAAV
ncbi:MAG TPA: 30S ribosomal protein S16 [Gammaproteobacteria bacterium]|jgi:small subunit ribosomal protein S16|nr:30S ribosomal protein S16 [Gammaproteobacteria bacterium]